MSFITPRINRSVVLMIAVFVFGWGEQAAGATFNVSIGDDFFSPASITVNSGDTVVWTNQGSRIHTVTSGTGCSPDGMFNSGNKGPGGTFSFTFGASGTFPYFCIPHCPSMAGTVTVSGGGQGLTCSASAAPTSGTAPLQVVFSASASGGAGGYSYAWTFGDGAGGTGVSVTHTYANPGSYAWSLTVTDGAAQTCLQGGTVTVTQEAFSCSAFPSTDTGPAPLTVDFMGTATGGTMPYSYVWDFGDGGGSSQPNPQHTYLSAGVYQWVFAVTDMAGGSCQRTGTITATSATIDCSASASPSVGEPPLEVAFTAAVTGGTPPYTYLWDFGDGTSGMGNPTSHTYPVGGTFVWSVTMTDSAGANCQDAGTIVVTVGSSVSFLSTVARIGGAQGTDWRTDAMLFNPAPTAVRYDLLLTRQTGPEETETLSHSGLLGGMESPLLENLVESLFGLGGVAGSLRVVSEGPIMITSRTYNQTPEGTYGQFVSGQGAGAALGSSAVRAGEAGHLIGLQHAEEYRTNIGFTDISGNGSSLRVTLRNAGGEVLVDGHPVALLPWAWVQRSLAEMGLASGQDLRAEVMVETGAILAYASVVDNRTGDAVYLPAQKAPPSGAALHRIVAAAAKTRGGFDTDWSTDLTLFNPTDQARTVSVEFHAGGQPVRSADRTLAPNAMEVIRDLVGSLFPDAGSNAAGSLHLRADGPFLASSRTFNTTGEGTYGQSIPAMGEEECLGPSQAGQVLQVASTPTYRCNLGFSEFAGVDTTLTLTLFDQAGMIVAVSPEPVRVPAFRNIQGRLEDLIPGAGLLTGGRVEVTVLSGGRVAAYASVADNRTGDAIFIPALR